MGVPKKTEKDKQEAVMKTLQGKETHTENELGPI